MTLTNTINFIERTLYNDRVITLNNLKLDIVTRYNNYNEFAENYVFNDIVYRNVLDIAHNETLRNRNAILSELKNDILARAKIARCKELSKHDKKVTYSIVKRAERETLKKIDVKNDVSMVWECTTINYHVFNFDDYIYTKIVQYSKNKMLGLKYCEGEFTLEFIINGIFTKYFELLLNDNKLITVQNATIEHKINALIHTFAIIKKSLALLNYGTSAKYTENEKTSYSVFYGDHLSKIETNKNNIDYGNYRTMNTKHVTIIDLLKQWENRNSHNERAFYVYDDGISEDFTSNINLDDELVENYYKYKARAIADKIKRNTNNMQRIKDIIKYNLQDGASKKALSKWKSKNKLNECSRDDLYYLFVM